MGRSGVNKKSIGHKRAGDGCRDKTIDRETRGWPVFWAAMGGEVAAQAITAKDKILVGGGRRSGRRPKISHSLAREGEGCQETRC